MSDLTKKMKCDTLISELAESSLKNVYGKRKTFSSAYLSGDDASSRNLPTTISQTREQRGKRIIRNGFSRAVLLVWSFRIDPRDKSAKELVIAYPDNSAPGYAHAFL